MYHVVGDIDNGAATMGGGEYIENFCMNFSLNFFMNLKLLYKVLDLKSGFVTQTYTSCAAAATKSLQSCLTRCDPIEGSPPSSAVPGILQARTLEWVAISFSNRRKWKVKVKSLSHVWLLATPWTAAHHAPPSMGFSRQECWSGVPYTSCTNPLIF